MTLGRSPASNLVAYASRVWLLGAVAIGGCGSAERADRPRSSGDAAGTAGLDGGQDESDGGVATDSAGDDLNVGLVVRGTVVDLTTTRPFAGRTVIIAGQSTTTDANGSFSLGSVGANYDAFVVEPDRSTVSIYRGLSRRDPVLPHMGIRSITGRALVNGNVSGGGNYPLAGSDLVNVYFFSPQADSLSTLGGGLPIGMAGPAYGPLRVAWDGPNSASGQLVAFGVFYGSAGGAIGDAGYSVGFVAQPLTLANGQSAFLNLALSPVTQAGHIAGAVQVPANAHLVQREVFYRFPIAHESLIVPAGGGSTVFDDVVPDLTSSGAQLCVGAAATPGSFLTQQCGIAFGKTDIAVTLQAPPTLLAPMSGAKVAKDAQFSWTNFSNGIHLLELQASAPSPSTPRVFLFTSDTRTAWPDLSPLGVSFPSAANYQCSIEGLGPYPSIDDALGPDGIGASYPAELRRSVSAPIQVKTTP